MCTVRAIVRGPGELIRLVLRNRVFARNRLCHSLSGAVQNAQVLKLVLCTAQILKHTIAQNESRRAHENDFGLFGAIMGFLMVSHLCTPPQILWHKGV